MGWPLCTVGLFFLYILILVIISVTDISSPHHSRGVFTTEADII